MLSGASQRHSVSARALMCKLELRLAQETPRPLTSLDLECAPVEVERESRDDHSSCRVRERELHISRHSPTSFARLVPKKGTKSNPSVTL